MTLSPGLYLVATPIGAANDITLRALEILRDADMLAAEDTRNTRHLLNIHGIRLEDRPLVPYHDHNGPQQRPRLLESLAAGKSIAYVSDAGTPLVADPGYRLAEATIAAGHNVYSAPGASALLAALSVAGLPTDRFLFAGFLPPKTVARKNTLADLAAIPATLVFFESPKRLRATLVDMADMLGQTRPAAVCRELTKKFEEVARGTLAALASRYDTPPKGEIVIVIGPPVVTAASPDTIDTALRTALEDGSVKDAATAVATALNIPRKQAYARALDLSRE